jgi:hypothetical protein
MGGDLFCFVSFVNLVVCCLVSEMMAFATKEQVMSEEYSFILKMTATKLSDRSDLAMLQNFAKRAGCSFAL